MNKAKIYIFTISIILFFNGASVFAHEPIYGNGPHVLFKGGFAPGFTIQSGLGFIETEYNLEYGLTTNFTIGTDLFFGNENRSYGYNGIKIKGKYRFYTEFMRGSMLQFSLLGGYKFSDGNRLPDVLTIGLAAGRESTVWYWFASAVYVDKSGGSLYGGDEINYDLTFGYRVTRLSYYKPDLVLFLEFIGKREFFSSIDGDVLLRSGGDSWAVAPTLMFTYRNYAIRSGVEIGIGENGFLKRPETNFRISVEMHI